MIDTLQIALTQYSCLAKYALRETVCERLNPGWSGAESWRITCPRVSYSLRDWPTEYPSAAVLTWQQAVLNHALARNFHLIPRIKQTVTGAGFFLHAGRLWELTEWIAGEPVGDLLSRPELIAAAFASVAEFHQAVADFALPFPCEDQPASRIGPPPGLMSRCQMLQSLLTGELEKLEIAAKQHHSREFREFAAAILAKVYQLGPLLLPGWLVAAKLFVRIFPCWRDLRPEHLLFDRNQVVGWLDYGSLRPDVAAADLSRLMTEMPTNRSDLRDLAIKSYETIRPLNAAELDLISIYVESSRLLSGANWIRWIAVEQREFPWNERLFDHWRQILRRQTELTTE